MPHGGLITLPIVVLNIALCLFSLGYVAMHAGAMGFAVVWLVPLTVALWYLADVISGAVHWSLDTWFSETSFADRLIAVAREHHTHPQNILKYGFFERATLGSIPSVAVLGPLAMVLAVQAPSTATVFGMYGVLMLAASLLFGTDFHNFGHRWAGSSLGRALQRGHIVLTPAHHMRHHRGDHTTHYCTLNGWANPMCDRLKVWRRLERTIAAATGAEPRRNDREWAHHFETTGRLPAIPSDATLYGKRRPR
ncbi:MAG: fatty acid desaturase CarF family protein [Acuticoccus sp.]